MNVIVFKHPGYADRIEGTLIPGLDEIAVAAGVPPRSVVVTDEDTLSVLSRHVFTPEGLRYAQEWAAKSGRPVFDVYIPEALRVR